MTFCGQLDITVPTNYQQPTTLTNREAFRACIAQNDVANVLWNMGFCTANDLNLAIESKAFDVAKEICKTFDGYPNLSIWTDAANASMEAKEWEFFTYVLENCIKLTLWMPFKLTESAPFFKNRHIYNQNLFWINSSPLETCLHIAKTGGVSLKYHRNTKLEMLKENVVSLSIALATLDLPTLLLAELIKHAEQPFINFLSDYELEVLLPKKKRL